MLMGSVYDFLMFWICFSFHCFGRNQQEKPNRPHSVSDWGEYSESLGEAEGMGHHQKNGGPKTHLYL